MLLSEISAIEKPLPLLCAQGKLLNAESKKGENKGRI